MRIFCFLLSLFGRQKVTKKPFDLVRRFLSHCRSTKPRQTIANQFSALIAHIRKQFPFHINSSGDHFRYRCTRSKTSARVNNAFIYDFTECLLTVC